jgi:Ca-activated chloride channel family protein
VGKDYNEDLLEAMALSGDGNYYFIEAPGQLPAIFEAELRGLMATVGSGVSLAVETTNGVTVADVLNDLGRDDQGRLLLPNLMAGMPVEVVLRLNVPPQSRPEHLASFTLSWADPKRGVRSLAARLHLSPVGPEHWETLAPDVSVAERVALQLAGRCKRAATRHLERREREAAAEWLRKARSVLAGLPHTPLLDEEERDQAELEQRLEAGDLAGTAKACKFQHYNRQNSRPRLAE